MIQVHCRIWPYAKLHYNTGWLKTIHTLVHNWPYVTVNALNKYANSSRTSLQTSLHGPESLQASSHWTDWSATPVATSHFSEILCPTVDSLSNDLQLITVGLHVSWQKKDVYRIRPRRSPYRSGSFLHPLRGVITPQLLYNAPGIRLLIPPNSSQQLFWAFAHSRPTRPDPHPEVDTLPAVKS